MPLCKSSYLRPHQLFDDQLELFLSGEGARLVLGSRLVLGAHFFGYGDMPANKSITPLPSAASPLRCLAPWAPRDITTKGEAQLKLHQELPLERPGGNQVISEHVIVPAIISKNALRRCTQGA